MTRHICGAVFTANYLQDQLDEQAKGTTGYAAVRPRNLLTCKIPLPPLDEQQRIVARIEQLAAKIEEARGLRDIKLPTKLKRFYPGNCLSCRRRVQDCWLQAYHVWKTLAKS